MAVTVFDSLVSWSIEEEEMGRELFDAGNGITTCKQCMTGMESYMETSNTGIGDK